MGLTENNNNNNTESKDEEENGRAQTGPFYSFPAASQSVIVDLWRPFDGKQLTD
jgi:hypothetical protein